MKRQQILIEGIVVACVSLFGAVAPQAVHADSTSGDIFYTTFSGDDRVFKRSYSFDGTTLTYGLEGIVSSLSKGLGGADGLVFDPTDTSFLLVGGQNTHVYRVDTSTGTATASSDTGTSIFHLAIDGSGTSVWGSGIPGSPIANVSLTPFSSSFSTLPIIGAESAITGLAFVPGGSVYYTSSGPGGGGTFGTIDLSTGVTTRIASGVDAAHGLSFDPFSGDLILFGDDKISQYKPGTGFVSTYPAAGSNQFDQGSIDGKGHLFGASNDGDMLFIDYNTSGLVGDAGNFVDLRFFRDSLDDVAPLVGLGSHPVVPEPTSLLLFGIGGLGMGLTRRARKFIA